MSILRDFVVSTQIHGMFVEIATFSGVPMKILVFLVFSAAATAHAQTAFCRLFWEASDGGSWTRARLDTTNQQIGVRLVAEWGAPNAQAFGRTVFDAVIAGSHAQDASGNYMRGSGLGFISQTIREYRFGSDIKIDDSRDGFPPGQGTYGVNCQQTNGAFGEILNTTNPIVLFSFDLTFENTAGIRHIHSLHLPITGSTNTTRIWLVSGDPTDVIATQAELDVNYVPAPGWVTVIGGGVVAALRRKR